MSAAWLALFLAVQEESIRSLVEKLGSDRVEERQEAARELRRRGLAAAAELERAARSDDPEVAERARELLRRVPSLAVVESRVLARVHSSVEYRQAVFHAGGSRASLLTRWPAGDFVDVGMRSGRLYDCVEGLTLSPDGTRVAYVARRGADHFVVVDDEVLYRGRGAPGLPLVFSPDSRRLAYEVREDGRSSLHLDGRTSRAFESISDVVFSLDGREVAFRAKEDTKEVIVAGGRIGRPFWRVGRPVFGADGRAAYTAGHFLDPTLVVGDQVRRMDAEFVQQALFSPDGRTLAFSVFRGGEYAITVGEATRKAMGTIVGPLVFTPDGREVAYVGVGPGGEWFATLGEERGETHERIDPYSLRVSPDGRRVAYSASRGKKAFMVTGEGPGAEFVGVGEPVWSPDGSRVAYTANVDGERDDLGTVKGGRECVVVGDWFTDSFDQVWTPVFSPDGRRVGFGARAGAELRWVVVEAK